MMGCPFRDHCREDCDLCTNEKRADKLADLIDQAKDREEERIQSRNEKVVIVKLNVLLIEYLETHFKKRIHDLKISTTHIERYSLLYRERVGLQRREIATIQSLLLELKNAKQETE